MDSQEMLDTPPITSFALDDEPPNRTRVKLTQPWEAPFVELLDLLKVVNASQSNPQTDGHRFCFQPSHDLSEISKIFLSVSTSGIQYEIDLKTIRFLGSDTVPTAVSKLQEYASHVLRRTQLFRDHLLERSAIEDISDFLSVDLSTCPLCHNSLIACRDCDSMVACGDPACPASFGIPCEFCYVHQLMSCHACLARNDTLPSLICCSMCGGWCCKGDTEWCPGLIIDPALGTQELAELSRNRDWDHESIVRSHPPKPGVCGSCIDPDEGRAPGWAMCRNRAHETVPDHCPSQTSFLMRLGLLASYCSECVDKSPGCRCACGETWLCDTCIAIGNKSIIYPYFITCPRCGASYCTGPNRACDNCIEICRGCKGAIPCNNCQEEEELPGEVQSIMERPKQVEFNDRCGYCEAWTCTDCRASACTATCVSCDLWFCYGCVSDLEDYTIRRCRFCNAYVCRHCRMDHDRTCLGPVSMMDMLQYHTAPGGVFFVSHHGP